MTIAAMEIKCPVCDADWISMPFAGIIHEGQPSDLLCTCGAIVEVTYRVKQAKKCVHCDEYKLYDELLLLDDDTLICEDCAQHVSDMGHELSLGDDAE